MRISYCLIVSWVAASVFAGEIVEGKFIQRKHLHDLGVTLKSSGNFYFNEGHSFIWHTLSPAESVFTATPTNYSVAAAGVTNYYPLVTKVRKLEDVFTIREVKQFVEKVDLKRDTGVTNLIPSGVTVQFRNGDYTEITLKPTAIK